MTEYEKKMSKKVEKRLDKVEEHVIDSVYNAAKEFLIENPRTHAKTALATAYYVSEKNISQKNAANKFGISSTPITKNAEKMANLQGVKKEEYRSPSKTPVIKERIIKAAEKLNWEQGKHYKVITKKSCAGGEYKVYRLLSKGKIELFDKVLKNES